MIFPLLFGMILRAGYQESIRKGSVNYIFTYKVNRNDLSIVAIQSFSSPSKKELMKLEEKYTFWASLPRRILDTLKELRSDKVEVNIITLSLNPLTASRIESILPDLLPIESSKIYSEKLEYDSIKVYSKFYFVSGIKSFRSLRDKLDEIVLDMKNN